MKKEYKGYIIKVEFWGDSTTPMYRYKLYEPRKWFFNILLLTVSFHRTEIHGKLSDKFDEVISMYEDELEKWN